MPEKEEKSWFN